jgi:hypothetical protein
MRKVIVLMVAALCILGVAGVASAERGPIVILSSSGH